MTAAGSPMKPALSLLVMGGLRGLPDPSACPADRHFKYDEAQELAMHTISSGMAAERYDLFIDGREVPSVSGSYFDVENPADRSVVTRVAEGGPADIELALDAAHRVHAAGTWRNMDPRARAKILEKAAEILATKIESIAALESLQTGRPIKEMTAQLRRLPEWFQYFAALIRTQEGTCPPFLGNYLNYVRRVPLGVVAQITPWNHPLLISIKKLAPAIATGNCVVMKPSELAPVAPLLLARILHEAGLPSGVFNVVSGLGAAAGAALCGSPRVKLVDLTGGTPTGRIVAAAAGRNLASCVMELGGKAPVIVFDDADVDNAVNGAAFAAFIASGQTCIAGSRLLVHTDIYDEFTAKLVSKVKSIKIGLPSDISTQLGPVICGPQLSKIDGMCRQAEQEGATILTGGKRVSIEPFANGYYFEPTVIAVDTHHTVWREEVFGPVTVIIRFGSEDEAVRLANDSPFGLAASVWTREVSRAHRVAHQMDVGLVWINDHHRNDPASPWGGTKDSGIGRENGLEALRQYTQTHSVVVNLSSQPFDWFVTDPNVRYS